jgi:hypothetical protein
MSHTVMLDTRSALGSSGPEWVTDRPCPAPAPAIDEAICACWDMIDLLESRLRARDAEMDAGRMAGVETAPFPAEPEETEILHPLPYFGLNSRVLPDDNPAERSPVRHGFPKVMPGERARAPAL